MLTTKKVKDLITEALNEYHVVNHSGTTPKLSRSAEEKETVPFTQEELKIEGAVPCWPSYQSDLEDDNFLMDHSKLDSLLLKALTDRGFANRFPKDARKKCLVALKSRIEKMNDEEKRVFHYMITNRYFATFSVVWQEVHTILEKDL